MPPLPPVPIRPERDHGGGPGAACAGRSGSAAQSRGAVPAGGTDRFRLCRVPDAGRWLDRLARRHVWTRVFAWSHRALRRGLPPAHGWAQPEAAL